VAVELDGAYGGPRRRLRARRRVGARVEGEAALLRPRERSGATAPSSGIQRPPRSLSGSFPSLAGVNCRSIQRPPRSLSGSFPSLAGVNCRSVARGCTSGVLILLQHYSPLSLLHRGGLKMQIQRIAGVSLRAPTPLAVGSKAANGEEWGGGGEEELGTCIILIYILYSSFQ
jgi:hypothetical protein